MKKLIFATLFIAFGISIHAQNWNPFVSDGAVTPAPMLPWEFDGTGVISFTVGNSGTDPIPLVADQEMTLVITLANGIPDNADPLAALGGDWLVYFDWSFITGDNTYFGEQNQEIPGSDQGTITIDYKVTVNTTQAAQGNGCNVNLQPPPFTNSSNSTADDAVNAYTYVRANDYGDAPMSYGEAGAEINVFKDINGNYENYVFLGDTIDHESSYLASAEADSDDMDNLNDEDGVSFPALIQGTSVTIPVVLTVYGGVGFLNAWIDWNGDGDFLDAGEQIVTNLVYASTQSVNLTLNVPPNASVGNTFARFRFGSPTGPFGFAEYGEVEDYMINIIASDPSIALSKTAFPLTYYAAGDQITYTFVVENDGNLNLTGVIITDPLFGLTFGPITLAPGESETYTYTYTITQADIDAGSIYNLASVTSTDPNGNPVTDTDDATVIAIQPPSIAIVKTGVFDEDSGTITYTYSVHNTGDVILSNVMVTELSAVFTGTGPLPNPVYVSSSLGSSEGTLQVFEIATYEAVYTVTQEDYDSGIVINQALAVGTSPDGSEVSDLSDHTSIFEGEDNPTETCVLIVTCPDDEFVCTDTPTYTLTGGMPAGGEYSGAGVSGNSFNAAEAGPGTHTITYTYNDLQIECTDSCSFEITVYPIPDVSCPLSLAVCFDEPAFALTGTSPVGGAYSGDGVSGDIFDPETAGAGIHVITYTYTDANGCTSSCQFEITVANELTASLSGTHEFCPGDCHEINTVITGGTEPYEATFTFSISIFNMPFTVPVYDVDNQLIICYTGENSIPTYDIASNTLIVPQWITGTGTLTLNSIVDGAGCGATSIAPDFTTLIFKDVLDINEASPLEECDYDFDGEVTFDLTVLNDQITGGQSNTSAEWFEDVDCTAAINGPGSFTTPSATVYVFVSHDNGDLCNSDTIEVELIVINIPNPGTDNELSACNDDPCVDIWSYLGPDAEDGGTWDNGGSGFDISSDPSCVNFFGAVPGAYQFTYSTQDSGGQCDPQSAVLSITISEEGNPGQDNEYIFCGPPADMVNLAFYLNNDFDPGGTWSSSGSFDLSNPNAVDMSGAASGTYFFYYTIENIPCDPVNSTITIEIIDEPNPGNDATVEVCNSGTNTVVNLENELGPHDPNGDWYDQDFNYVVHPTYVDFTGYEPGEYEYNYIIAETDICPEASAVITVLVQEGANAGIDSTYYICEGSEEIIDLHSYLGDHDDGGSWLQLTGEAVSLNNPNSVSFSDKTWGFYNFNYTVTGECGSEVATVTIVIEPVLSAGDDYHYDICQNSNVNLFDSLTNYDLGGSWINENDDPVGPNQELTKVITYTFRYVQTENDGCPNDTSFAVIDIIPLPFAGNDNTFFICEGAPDTIDLYSYLGPYYDTTGTWWNILNEDIIAVSNEASFSTSPVGLDSFLYIVSGECGSDTALVIANITTSPSAGDDYIYDVCRYQLINLYDSLLNYSAGGIWFDENGDVVHDYNNVFLDSAKTYTFKYLIPASGICLADSAYAVINVIEPPNAGAGVDFAICEGSGSIVNLFDYLSGDYDSEGSWKLATDTIPDPDAFDLSSYLPGTYELIYSLPPNEVCPGSSTNLMISMIARHNPGIDAQVEVCNSNINTILNLEELIGDHDDDGIWTKAAGNPVIISDQQNVDFEGIPDGIYSFYYLIEGQNVCPPDSSEVIVEVFNRLDAGIDRARTFCFGDDILVNILDELGPDLGTEIIIEDVDQAGALDNNTYEIDISQLSLGTYVFILSVGQEHICGPDSSQLTINVVDAPNAGSDNNVSVCNNESGIDLDALLGTHDEGGIWVDIDNSGIELQTSQGRNISFENIDEGTYRYMYMHPASGACPETNAIITVNVNPVSSSNVSMSICPGENIVVNGNIYDLNNPSGIEIMTNSFGCDSIITIEISEKIISAIALTEDENCFGSGHFIINDLQEANLPATLTIDNIGTYQVNTLPFSVSNIPSGTYNFEISDQNGCSISGHTFYIGEFVPFYIDIKVTDLGNSYRLEVITDIIPQTIVWTPEEGLSCSDCLVTTASATSDQHYIVEITDADSCKVSDEIFLERLVDVEIYIPNTFTPNGDGINDKFYASCDDCDLTYSMMIFDRWGEKMFEAKDIHFNDQASGWDGNFRGKKVVTGVYVYLIETELKKDVKEAIAGDLLILK